MSNPNESILTRPQDFGFSRYLNSRISTTQNQDNTRFSPSMNMEIQATETIPHIVDQEKSVASVQGTEQGCSLLELLKAAEMNQDTISTKVRPTRNRPAPNHQPSNRPKRAVTLKRHRNGAIKNETASLPNAPPLAVLAVSRSNLAPTLPSNDHLDALFKVIQEKMKPIEDESIKDFDPALVTNYKSPIWSTRKNTTTADETDKESFDESALLSPIDPKDDDENGAAIDSAVDLCDEKAHHSAVTPALDENITQKNSPLFDSILSDVSEKTDGDHVTSPEILPTQSYESEEVVEYDIKANEKTVEPEEEKNELKPTQEGVVQEPPVAHLSVQEVQKTMSSSQYPAPATHNIPMERYNMYYPPPQSNPYYQSYPMQQQQQQPYQQQQHHHNYSALSFSGNTSEHVPSYYYQSYPNPHPHSRGHHYPAPPYYDARHHGGGAYHSYYNQPDAYYYEDAKQYRRYPPNHHHHHAAAAAAASVNAHRNRYTPYPYPYPPPQPQHQHPPQNQPQHHQGYEYPREQGLIYS